MTVYVWIVTGGLMVLGTLAFLWGALWMALFILDKIAKKLGIMRAFFEFCVQRNMQRERKAGGDR